jgi:hypothetical protein
MGYRATAKLSIERFILSQIGYGESNALLPLEREGYILKKELTGIFWRSGQIFFELP